MKTVSSVLILRALLFCANRNNYVPKNIFENLKKNRWAGILGLLPDIFGASRDENEDSSDRRGLVYGLTYHEKGGSDQKVFVFEIEIFWENQTKTCLRRKLIFW